MSPAEVPARTSPNHHETRARYAALFFAFARHLGIEPEEFRPGRPIAPLGLTAVRFCVGCEQLQAPPNRPHVSELAAAVSEQEALVAFRTLDHYRLHAGGTMAPSTRKLFMWLYPATPYDFTSVTRCDTLVKSLRELGHPAQTPAEEARASLGVTLHRMFQRQQ